MECLGTQKQIYQEEHFSPFRVSKERRNSMKFALGLTVAVALILAPQIDQPAAQTQPAALDATQGPLKLSEQDRATVIKAAVEAKSHQKTPKDFTPAVGAPVPRALYSHAFKPEVVRNVPTLKHYWYAHLDREIVLIDSMQKKVVAVIPLPANFVSGGQGNHGAAEPEDESKSARSKSKDGASTTGSVPAYTSPETIK
jgi:hypothetical protein